MATTSKKKKTAKQIEKQFDEGDSVLDLAVTGTTTAHRATASHVNVKFPRWMIEALDKEADRLAIDRQAVIKMIIDSGLKEKGYG